jgi:hypothetical protein
MVQQVGLEISVQQVAVAVAAVVTGLMHTCNPQVQMVDPVVEILHGPRAAKHVLWL